MQSRQYPDRGTVGPTPAMTSRADETFLEYIKDIRSVLLWGPSKDVHPKANAVIEAEGIDIKTTDESVEAVRGRWCAASCRKRASGRGFTGQPRRRSGTASANPMTWREDEFLGMLDEADQMGPGSVQWDPDYGVSRLRQGGDSSAAGWVCWTSAGWLALRLRHTGLCRQGQ